MHERLSLGAEAAALWGARLSACREAGKNLEFDFVLSVSGESFLLSRGRNFVPEVVSELEGGARLVQFRFSPQGLSRLLKREASPQLLFRTGELHIEGDAELALLACSLLEM